MSNEEQSVHTPQPDVAAILEALRAEVRARRMAQTPSQADPIERDLQRSLDEIELHRVISAHWPLIGKSVPERAVALLNKLVRRYLRWYINPIVEQQNAYNDAVARTLRLLAEAYADLARPVDPQEPGDQARAMPQVGTAMPVSANSDLQALVRARGALEPPAHFPDLDLQAAAVQLRLRAQVSAHWPLPANSLAGRLITLLNKLVRRYLRWYINPIVEQQNAANAAFSTALLQLIRLDAQRRAEAAARRATRRKGIA